MGDVLACGLFFECFESGEGDDDGEGYRQCIDSCRVAFMVAVEFCISQYGNESGACPNPEALAACGATARQVFSACTASCSNDRSGP